MKQIRLILNATEIQAEVPPGQLVLDFLREERRLTGTKEGCREGDCGACVVLVGSLEDDHVHYRAVTSCLMPAIELHGKHLVTIEGLRLQGLSTVQRAIIQEGASQCGFCTPGIVMSLTGSLMASEVPLSPASVKTALGGHLCRCTGYRSLKATANHLANLTPGVTQLVQQSELAAYFLEIPGRLGAIQNTNHRAHPAPVRVIAGGTDLYVQDGDELARSSGVVSISERADLRGIFEEDGHLVIGPATTFEELATNRHFKALVPNIRAIMDDIASLQIRNRATVGGNLINASPIGDVTILLLAFDTSLTLEGPDGATRTVPLNRFYLGYKEMDLQPGELLTRITIAQPAPNSRVHWEKVAKRRTLDIASVNSALRLRVGERTILEATLTAGGVAPVPKVLERTSHWMIGQPLTAATVQEAGRRARDEVVPISDIRGSADYKRLLLERLVWAHFEALFPEHITLQALFEGVA